MANPKSDHSPPANWEDVKKTTQSFANSILRSTREAIEDTYDSSRDKFTDTLEDFGKDARRIVKSTETYIKKNPISFVVGALAVGLVLGLLLKRRR